MTGPGLSTGWCRLAGFVMSVMALTGCGAAQADGSTAPLHSVREGHGDVGGMKINIQTSYNACLASMGQSPAPAPLPSDSMLSAFVVQRIEEFFDKTKWAEYKTLQLISADKANHCNLAVFVSRSVEIKDTCKSRIGGTSGPILELIDGKPPAPDAGQVREAAAGDLPECRKTLAPVDADGLPSEDAGHGFRCVWSSVLLARTLHKTGLPPTAGPQKVDFCLYDRQPYYIQMGFKRMVVLKQKWDMTSIGGGYIPSLIGAMAAAGNLQLTAFTHDSAIPADRFTRAAAAAFLSQPTKSAVGR